MRMTSPGRNSKPPKNISVVLFSVGRRQLAARAEEVGGIWPWTSTTAVPSGTTFVHAIIRRGDEIMPVYDMADRLQVEVDGSNRLCLIAKRHDGPMALCIDGVIPTLHVLDPESIRSARGSEADVEGTCRIGEHEVPIYSLVNLGLSPHEAPPIGAQTAQVLMSRRAYAEDSGC
ncbi:MAG: chemotaxis protein CheW [Nitrospiraceae bacterium]